jgi:hypothetical protein
VRTNEPRALLAQVNVRYPRLVPAQCEGQVEYWDHPQGPTPSLAPKENVGSLRRINARLVLCCAGRDRRDGLSNWALPALSSSSLIICEEEQVPVLRASARAAGMIPSSFTEIDAARASPHALQSSYRPIPAVVVEGFPADDRKAEEACTRLLARKPSAVIAIERQGANAKGVYHQLRQHPGRRDVHGTDCRTGPSRRCPLRACASLHAGAAGVDPNGSRKPPAPEGPARRGGPDPFNLPRGCPFVSRCPRALPQCREVPPPQVVLSSAHMVECHLYDA